MSAVAPSHPSGPPSARYTPDDVLAMSDRIVELVDGRLVEKTLGAEASWIATAMYRAMFPVSEAKGLGILMVESFVQAFPRDPNRIRRPDLLFATMSHFP